MTDETLEEVLRRTRIEHQHRRLVGGYVACACGGDWTDHRVHVAHELSEATRRSIANRAGGA